MRYLLDTNVISEFFRRHPRVVHHFGHVPPAWLAISAVTVLEIEYGMTRQPSARQKFGAIWAEIQTQLHVLPFEPQDAVQTALIRAHLATQGTPIGPYDLQLAGTALARRLTVVTHNTAEFARVPDLPLADWQSE